jgi:hypothetical protein
MSQHSEDVKAVKDLSHEPASSDEYISYGITDDFAWYELTQMTDEMRALASRFANMERILKSRSVDQRRYVDYLESKVRMLKELVPQDAKE